MILQSEIQELTEDLERAYSRIEDLEDSLNDFHKVHKEILTLVEGMNLEVAKLRKELARYATEEARRDYAERSEARTRADAPPSMKATGHSRWATDFAGAKKHLEEVKADYWRGMLESKPPVGKGN